MVAFGVAAVVALAVVAPVAQASLSVPTGGSPVTFSGAGTPGTATAMADFEAAAGGSDNGTTAGEQSGGFRHVTWDDIALDGSDPGSTVIRAGHVVAVAGDRMQPWGLELGPEVAVAGDGFASVNSHAGFGPYSSPNQWAPFNSNTTTLQIVAPSPQGATPVAAQTRGLGVVFLNVQSAGTTIQYYNDQALLGTASAPVGATSFAGLLFPHAVVNRVVITLGTADIFGFDGSTVTPGGSNSSTLVSGDDVLLAEPGPARPAVVATAGVPTTPVLDTFTETNSGATAADFTATIDWGDGTRSVGTVVPGTGGAFVLTGSHAYAQSGTYTAVVTVGDFTGSEQTSDTVIEVAPRATQTTLSCTPSSVAVTASTTCTAIVTDTDAGTPSAPTGVVSFSSPAAGAAFATDSGCMLGASAMPGVSLCMMQFTPSLRPPNQARIAAVYGGDGAHDASSTQTTLTVTAQRCTLAPLTHRLGPRTRRLGLIVTCDARTTIQISAKALIGRHGPFKAFHVAFGSLRAIVGAGRPTVLEIKPAHGVLHLLRAAAGRHQRVSLKLTLTASSRVTRTTTSVRVAALRIS